MPETDVHVFPAEVELRLVPDPALRAGCWFDPEANDVFSMPVGWKPDKTRKVAKPKPEATQE